MHSDSDSDTLPDITQAIAALKNIPIVNLRKQSTKRKKRPLSPHPSTSGRGQKDPPEAPRKKRKLRKSKAKASSPIELTSEDEPKYSKGRVTTGNSCKPTDVIDLCSDTEDPPRPPRSTRTRLPQEGDTVILLLSSDDELPPTIQPRLRTPTLNLLNGVHSPAPGTGSPAVTPTLNIHMSLTAAGLVQVDTIETSQGTLEPTPPDITSEKNTPSISTTLTVHEQSPSPIHQTSTVTKTHPSADDEKPLGRLQGIYKEALRNASSDEGAALPYCAFPSKGKSKPHSPLRTLQLEIFTPGSPLPPLLTPLFFNRFRQGLSPPRNSLTGVQAASSMILSRDTTATVASVQDTPNSRPPKIYVGAQSSKSLDQPETTVVEETSRVVIEIDAQPAEPQTPVVEKASPLPPHTSRSEFTSSRRSLGLQEIDEAAPPQPNTKESVADLTVDAIASRGSTTIQISTPPPLQYASPVPVNVVADAEGVQPNAHVSDPELDSATSTQEIAEMLANGPEDITDEELLAIGLCYPELDT